MYAPGFGRNIQYGSGSKHAEVSREFTNNSVP